jgi:hypothetical protein
MVRRSASLARPGPGTRDPRPAAWGPRSQAVPVVHMALQTPLRSFFFALDKDFRSQDPSLLRTGAEVRDQLQYRCVYKQVSLGDSVGCRV